MSEPPGLNGRCDVAVIGGGVHGAAAALEATRLGWDVLLVEKNDFCSATSANSLRIIHGGLRYLQSGNIRRSRESAVEQHRLLESAPHLVRPLTCLMGTDRSLTRGRLAMSLGLWFYDSFVCLGLPGRTRGRLLSPGEAQSLVGLSAFDGCTGAAMWRDAQVIDSERLVLTYLKSAERRGARVLNYSEAVGVSGGGPSVLEVRDVFTDQTSTIRADVVIDTASFVEPHRAWTRAVNLVLNRRFPEYALGMKLSGRGREAGRLLFATPADGRTIVGTWYFPDRAESPERLSPPELRRCLSDVRELLPDLGVKDDDVARVHLGRLPARDPSDPLSLLESPVIRPLPDNDRVICVTGVKYTTAGSTARKTMRKAGLAGARAPRETSPWYGAGPPREMTERAVRSRFAESGAAADHEPVVRRLCRQYGSVAASIAETAAELPNGFDRIPQCAGIRAEIAYCIEHEHCRTLADFLMRRSGIASLGAPPDAAVRYCAAAMAERLGWDDARVRVEIDDLEAACRAT